MSKSFVAETQTIQFLNNFTQWISHLEFLQLLDRKNRELVERGDNELVLQSEADEAIAFYIASRYLPERSVPEYIEQYL